MYGTVTRLLVKPGQEQALQEHHARWLRERKLESTGFIADYALKSERVPGEWIVLVVFDTEEHYRKNADDPVQHRQYEELRALLSAEPEWNDGEVFSFEPASVPI